MNRVKYYFRLFLDLLSIPLVVLMPRNRRKIIFGAWGGKQFSCNPKYLFCYMVKRSGFNCIWIGERHLKDAVLSVPGAKFVRKGSLAALWHCLTARYYACNVNWRSDVINIPRCRRVTLLYLSHGYPDKLMGDNQYTGNGKAGNAEAVHKSWLRRQAIKFLSSLEDFLYGQASWSSASAEQGTRLRVEGVPWRLSYDRMLNAGTPRGDYMLSSSNDKELKQRLRDKYSEMLDLPIDKEWYIFVPTWRHEKEYLYSFTQSQRLDEINALLESQNAIIIEKQHPKTMEDLGIKGGRHGEVYAVSRDQARRVDMQELLVACDRLITDYSSVYYDFVLLNRPVIHYTYDYDHFMNLDMGFCFDMRQYGGGPFAYTEDELMSCMKLSDAELIARRSPRTVSEQLSYEKGHSCETYYAWLEEMTRHPKFWSV